MNQLIIAAAAVVAAASFSHAYADADQRSKAVPESSTFCYSFAGAPRVTISREGNILLYQGANGMDHIYREGYALCDSVGGNRYSTNTTDVGFGPANCSCNSSTNTCTVTRDTSDGRLRLTQVLKKALDKNRTFDITMTVRNIGGTTVNGVILRRLATFDINKSISEWHEGPLDSSAAWGTKAAGIPYAVRLRHIDRTPRPGTTYEAKTPIFGDNSCNPADQTAGGPVFGDYDSTVQYNFGSIGPSASKSAQVQYLRD